MKNVRIILTSCFVCLCFLLLGSVNEVNAQSAKQTATLKEKVSKVSVEKPKQTVLGTSCQKGKYQKLQKSVSNGTLQGSAKKIAAEQTKLEKMKKKADVGQISTTEKEVISSEFKTIEKMKAVGDITSENWNPDASNIAEPVEKLAQETVEMDKLRVSTTAEASPATAVIAPVNNQGAMIMQKAAHRAERAEELYSIPGVTNKLNDMKQSNSALYQDFMSDKNEIIRLLNKEELKENHIEALKAYQTKYDIQIANQ